MISFIIKWPSVLPEKLVCSFKPDRGKKDRGKSVADVMVVYASIMSYIGEAEFVTNHKLREYKMIKRVQANR